MVKPSNGDLVEGGSRPQRIIRRGELPSITGYSIPHIYELIGRGEFPAPIPLGRRAVGWLAREVSEWQEARIAKRDGRAA